MTGLSAEALQISIHAPHEGERRAVIFALSCIISYFNPRSPRGGATTARLLQGSGRRYFNPRSPRGGATITALTDAAGTTISIHAPHEGERLGYPTLTADASDIISIHAPHEGERRHPAAGLSTSYRISIHAPHEGERRRAARVRAYCPPISIHAPHEGERRL